MAKKQIVKVRVRGDRDDMWTKGEQLGLKGGSLSMFSHAVSDLEIVLEVDSEGIAKILAADNKVLGGVYE
jgi:hypothetical protein